MPTANPPVAQITRAKSGSSAKSDVTQMFNMVTAIVLSRSKVLSLGVPFSLMSI